MPGITADRARRILDLGGDDLVATLAEAGRARSAAFGSTVDLCSIVNAKSGLCGEDCAFCAQSSRATGDAPRYGLLGADEIVRAAREAREAGAARFSIVTSGRALSSEREVAVVEEAIRRITSEIGLGACASLGCVDRGVLARLLAAGMSRYHHNMETAGSFWPRVCTTRPYEASRRVVEEALGLGLEVCSGGIFGMGESLDQRIELLAEIRDLGVHAVALNFFTPIPGTPLEAADDLGPLDGLRIIAAARLMMPDRDIRLCGGRERRLRDLQSLVFVAGASGMMIGGYLTTPGRPAADDLRMIRDLGLEVARGEGARVDRSRDEPGTEGEGKK